MGETQHDEPQRDDDTIDFERVVHSMEELLDACGSESLPMLENLIEDHVDGSMYVWGAGNPGGCGDGDIEVCEPHLGRGTCFEFPFPVRELFESAEDFRAMFLIEGELLELADAIETIEGFEVELELDPDATDLPAHLRRRETSHGVLVQELSTYAFKTPMSGDATFGEWRQQRLLRRNPGLMVVDAFDDDLTLAAIRGQEPTSPSSQRRTRR